MTSPVQESFENFENLKFDPFESKDVLLDDSNGHDKNFYNNIQAVDTQYCLPSELLSLSEKLRINSEEVLRKILKNSRTFFLKQAPFLKFYV